MTIIEHPFKCSVCNTRRSNDVNHWWLVWEIQGRHDALVVMPWCNAAALDEGKEHLCGQTCVLTFYERWLAKKQVEEIDLQKQRLAAAEVPEVKN